MTKIIVAVGTTRGPKLAAAKEVVSAVGGELEPHGEFEVIGVNVPSGVSAMPISREHTMAGARGRAEALAEIARANGEPWKYFVGLEGGLDVIREGGKRLVFLQNWAYVSDTKGRSAYGQSGAVLLPEELATEVIDRGVELAQAIDAFAGGQGIRDAQGAWG